MTIFAFSFSFFLFFHTFFCPKDCAWINNCVGANNTRYFWRFLFMTSMLCFYLSVVIVDIFWNTAIFMNIYSKTFRDHTTGTRVPVTHFHVMMYFLTTDLLLSMLLLFAVLCGLILFLFLAYHVYLVASGTTTSETFKWEDVKYQIKHGEPVIIEPEGVTSNGNAGKGEKEDKDKDKTQSGKTKKKTAQSQAQPSQTQTAASKGERIVIDHPSKLKNIYHHGVFANIKEILFPPPL